MTQTKAEPKFSRRSFIKGAAALSATGALAGCTPQKEGLSETGEAATTVGAPETKYFAGSCAGNCTGGCALKVHVRDGQIVRFTAGDFPDPQYNRICSKGVSSVGRVYSSERVLYPMRRVEGANRGDGEFERISWEEAIDEIATKWKGYTDQYGPEAVSLLYGSGNYHIASGMGVLGPMRFLNTIGASRIQFNVDAAAAIGWVRAFGGVGNCNEAKDYLNAKTIICWGSNPAVSQLHVMHFILEAKEKGTKFVVIDPVYNATAAKADWFVPIKAGTDGALALGMLNYLFETGAISEELLKNKTNASFLIKEDGMFLRMSDLGVEPSAAIDPLTGEEVQNDPYAVWDASTGNAVPYTDAVDPAFKEVPAVNGMKVKTAYENAAEQIAAYPVDRAADITGVDADDIRELARLYVEEGPVATHAMMGVDHYFNGQYNSWAMCLVAGLTGNTGISGGGFGIPQALSTHLVNMNAFSPVDKQGNPCQGKGREMVCKEMNNVLDTNSYAGEPITVKSVYVCATNPMCTFADHNKTEEWFSKLDFIVVSEVAMTETAKYADILLPAAFWYEQTDVLAAFGTHPYLALTEKAIEPLGESKPDFEIQKLICEALGYGEFWDLTQDEFLEEVYNTEAAKEIGATYSDLKEKKIIKMWSDDTVIANKDGIYPTETGRIGMYYDTIVMQEYAIGQEIDASKELQLYWEEPRYAGPTSEARNTYPFHVLSDHMRTRTHTQWFDVESLREYEPEPVVRINPNDAAKLGLVEGDMARLSNEFGYVVLKVNINAGLPDGMVSSPRSYQSWEFADGHFTSLCSTEFNQVAANMNYNDVVVKIEKA